MIASALKRGLTVRFSSFVSMLHHGLALVGLAAMILFAVQMGRSWGASSDNRSTAIGQIRYDGLAFFEPVIDSEDPRYRALASYLSRRYKVAIDAAEPLVGAAYVVGQRVGLDPLIILAVMGIESGLNPIAESVMGAKGLMQVIPKHHQDKFDVSAGEQALLDPMTNILVGARILKEYIRRTGSVESGLQTYAGAMSDSTGTYAQKVMAEKERMRQALLRLERLTATKPAAA